jgi:hypothetical protein
MAFNSTNPVSVGDPTAKFHYDRVFDNTLAIQDGSTTLDAVDIVTGATTSSGFHMGEASTEGGWLTSEDDVTLHITAGGERVSGTWTARATESSRVSLVTGAIRFYVDTSLTDGNTFTPTERMAMTSTKLNTKDLHISMDEISDPSAPAANTCILYTRDTGGKTELVARFNTGAIQRVAIEP